MFAAAGPGTIDGRGDDAGGSPYAVKQAWAHLLPVSPCSAVFTKTSSS